MDDLLREFLTETSESLDTVEIPLTLAIEQIGEVLRLPEASCEENPVTSDPRMAKLAGGVHRLDGELMVVLDFDCVLELAPKASLAA
jgi:purine-binding chemotaxis protein CheW